MTRTPTTDCPILILAAGQSSRMRGRDKLLETVNDLPLLRLQCLRALATGATVFVALPASDTLRTALIRDLDVQILRVQNAALGLGETLRSSVSQLPACGAFMVIPADLVDIEAADMAAVMGARQSHPDLKIWQGTPGNGKPGHPVIFDASLRSEFANLSGDTGARGIVKRHSDQTWHVPLGPQALLDLDTPEEWAAWRSTTTT